MPEDEESERVAELENKVAELEATVRGLTEELVDATERIRMLEEATSVDPAGDHGGSADGEAEESSADPADAGPEPMTGDGADTTKAPESEEPADADDGEAVGDDDIIVA